MTWKIRDFDCISILHHMITQNLTLYSIDTHFEASTTVLLKTLWEKEKLLVTISPFPTIFSTQDTQIIVSPFVHIFDIISIFAAQLKEPKTDISGKGLTT